jgi:hypothetical protein
MTFRSFLLLLLIFLGTGWLGVPVSPQPINAATIPPEIFWEADTPARLISAAGATHLGNTPLATTGAIGGSVATVVVSGTLAYIGEGVTLTVLDVSSPARPSVRARLTLPQFVVDLQIVGGRVYVVCRNSLHIVDIRIPDRPVLLGSLLGAASVAESVQLVGDYAYITDSIDTHIIDVRDPAHPTFRKSLSGMYAPMRIVGSLAYAASSTGIQILDIRDPLNPKSLGNLTNIFARDFQVVGTLAYVVGYDKVLRIIDGSNPSSPVSRGSVATPEWSHSLQVVGGIAYIGYGEDSVPTGLYVVDVGNPMLPTVRSDTPTRGVARQLHVTGSRAYLAEWNNQRFNGLEILDVSDPADPVVLGVYSTPADVGSVHVVGGRAYVGDSIMGMYIADVDGATPLDWRGHIAVPGQVRSIDVVGDQAYLAYTAIYTSGAGLQIIDVSDPASPTLKSNLAIQSQVWQVQVAGDLAFMAAGDSLKVVDVSDSISPTIVSSLVMPQGARALRVVGDVAYVADGSLQVVDVADPAHPQLMFAGGPCCDDVQSLEVVGDRVYMTRGGIGHGGSWGAISIVDVGTPSNPTFLGEYPSPSNIWSVAQDVQLVDNIAIVAESERLVSLDVTDPANIREVGSYRLPDGAEQLRLANGKFYIASLSDGLLVVARLEHGRFLPLLRRV